MRSLKWWFCWVLLSSLSACSVEHAQRNLYEGMTQSPKARFETNPESGKANAPTYEQYQQERQQR